MAYATEELAELALRLVEEAERRGAQLRLLGGLAVYMNAPKGARLPELQRSYGDVDFVVNLKGAKVLNAVFSSQGWQDDHYFNALHGATRLLYYYQYSLQADIFIGAFAQCHKLELEKRLKLSSPTLPLADLLLTKLQIHQLNAKDVQDVFALLYDHGFRQDSGSEPIDLPYITGLAGEDWGWYTTLHDNLDQLVTLVGEILDEESAERVSGRLEELRAALEATPKSVRWKLRNQIGRRMLWYDEPEEVKR
jgi:hypothetical protein